MADLTLFNRSAALERELPDALAHASALSHFTPPEGIVDALSEGYGPLSQEFRKAGRWLRKGLPLGEALRRTGEESGSPLVRQAMRLLADGLASGADVSVALKLSAEHARALQRVRAERGSITMVEKYTLLLAGGIIVPLILGTMSHVVGGLDIAGFGAGQAEDVAANAVLGSQVYLVEYALIAAVFAGMLDDDPRKALLYAVVLVPASLGLFALAGG